MEVNIAINLSLIEGAKLASAVLRNMFIAMGKLISTRMVYILEWQKAIHFIYHYRVKRLSIKSLAQVFWKLRV
jgi:hypothetical protein